MRNLTGRVSCCLAKQMAVSAQPMRLRGKKLVENMRRKKRTMGKATSVWRKNTWGDGK